MRGRGRKFSHFVQLGACQTRDLTDEGIRGKKGIVTLGPLLDLLLIFLEFLKTIGIDVRNLESGRLINMFLITNDNEAHLGLGFEGQNDRATEFFLSSEIKILETDLEFNSFNELSFFGFF